ncbi:MAG: hypothetical protein ACRDKS_15750 [Actinomycetota bacterium]
MKHCFVVATILWVMLAWTAPASAKGEVVEVGISGGDLRGEVRVPADSADLTWKVGPAAGAVATPYKLTVYMRLTTNPPQVRAISTYDLLLDPAGRAGRLMYADGRWLTLSDRLVHEVELIVATPAADEVASRELPKPVHRTTAPWILGPLGLAGALGVLAWGRRAAVRTRRRLARATRA